MRIVQLNSSLRAGGAERQLLELTKYLSEKKNIDLHLILMSDEIHYSYLDNLDVKLHYLIRTRKNDLNIFNRLYNLLAGIHPDILHSWNAMCSLYAAPVAKYMKIHFVNGFLRNAPPYLSKKIWAISKLTFPFSDAIVANSYAGLRAYKVFSRKGFCVYNGFDFNRLNGMASKKCIVQKFNLLTGKVVGMVATFNDKKDYSTFIQAAVKILEKRNDVTFVAIGDGEYLEDNKSSVPINYQSSIKFLGKQRQVLSIVNCFDIGILATHGEGISNAIMEYMALKKPVIATDHGGNRELIEDNRTGFLVQAGNPEQLADKILFLLENKEKALEFGQNGYEKLFLEFNVDLMGAQFLKLYNLILD